MAVVSVVGVTHHQDVRAVTQRHDMSRDELTKEQKVSVGSRRKSLSEGDVIDKAAKRPDGQLCAGRQVS